MPLIAVIGRLRGTGGGAERAAVDVYVRSLVQVIRVAPSSAGAPQTFELTRSALVLRLAVRDARKRLAGPRRRKPSARQCSVLRGGERRTWQSGLRARNAALADGVGGAQRAAFDCREPVGRDAGVARVSD